MRLRAALALATILSALPATAQPAQPPFSVGVRLGGLFPSVYNNLQTSFLAEIELGYQLPVLGRRLGIFLDGGFTQPKKSGTITDPRLATSAGSASWNLTFTDVGIAAGLQFLQPVGDMFLVYGGAGPKLHLTRSVVRASSGDASLGENSERSTRVGLLLRAGAGLRLWKGALVIELHQEVVSTNHNILAAMDGGDKRNVSSLSAQLGYTLFL
jgi:opacity protein-like surface antigen